MTRHRNAFRNDSGRGRNRALNAAATELERNPDRPTTHAEIAAWLRDRAKNWSTEVAAPGTDDTTGDDE